MIRVLQVVTKMDAAGIETLLMNFYRNIDRNKVQFDFLTHRESSGYYDNEILSLGGKIFSVPPINPLRHQSYIRALKMFYYEHKEYKVVHSHINTFSMYPLRAAMEARIPVRIAHSHIANVPIDLKTPFRLYTKSKLKDYSTYNFACSNLAGKWLFGSSAIVKENFQVINNSINASLYTYSEKTKNRVKTVLGLEDKFVMSHIGRFNKQKNHDFLIEIFKIVHNKMPNSILLLIGEGELRNKIEQKVADFGLSDCVIFMGVRSDIPELLQATDVFVFPSLYEGLGIVAIEAQAAGVHCIVADTVPKDVIITDLVEQVPLNKGPKIWAESILRCVKYEKKNTLNEIRKAGFDMTEQAKKLENFYQMVAR